MSILNWLKQTPLWLVVPSVFLTAGVATAVTHYEPLVFDPSLYEVQTADAAELSTIDAEALEAANAADEPPADVELAAPSAVAASGAALADGTWTGYAACGQGNPDGWKPYYVGVIVNVSGGKSQGITRIFGSSTGNAGDVALSWDASENQKYLDWAISGRNGSAGVRSQLAGSSVASNVDTVSGATYSSAAIFNAYVDALGKAAKAAGGEVPVSAGMSAGASKSKSKSKGSKMESNPAVGTLADGTWTAYAQCGPDPDDDWKPYYVGVTLTVEGGAIVSVDRVFGSSSGEDGDPVLDWDESENGRYFDGALAGVGAKVKEAAARGRLVSSVDTVSGATFSSKSIFEAYYAALKKSADAAGSRIEVPENGVNESGSGEGGSASDVDPGAGHETSEPEGVSSEQPVSLADGFHLGYALCSGSASSFDSWDPYYIFVKIKVADGVVKEISDVYPDKEGAVDAAVVYSASQNDMYLEWAIEGKFGGTGYRMKSVVKQIQEKIDAGAAVSGISTVSGATRSSRAIIEAYGAALNAAVKQVEGESNGATDAALDSE